MKPDRFLPPSVANARARRQAILARKDAGETQTAIANDLKISRQRVSQIVQKARQERCPPDQAGPPKPEPRPPTQAPPPPAREPRPRTRTPRPPKQAPSQPEFECPAEYPPCLKYEACVGPFGYRNERCPPRLTVADTMPA